MRLGLLASILGGLLLGCGTGFDPPEKPDLYKEPYDFAVFDPNADLSANAMGDMARPRNDMAVVIKPDLLEPRDMTEGVDSQ
jgi:hypothetical protein